MKILIFTFLILIYSDYSHSGSWRLYNSGSTTCILDEKDDSLCVEDIKSKIGRDFPYHQELIPFGDWTKNSYNQWWHSYKVEYYYFDGDLDSSCSDSKKPSYPSTECIPEPDVTKCPKADTFHKKLSSGSEGLTGSTCVSNNCVIKIKHTLTTSPGSDTQRVYYNSFYTGQSCTFDSSNQGIKPEDHVWDESPVINPDDPNLVPTPDDPDLPPIGSDPSPTDPTPTPDAPKPNPNPTPTPDNPNLSEAENDLVGGISVTNQHLENIDDNIDRLRTANDANSKEALKYQQHILGELQNGTGSGGGGSGGDGEGEGEGGCDPEKSTCESDLNFGEPEVTNPFEDILSAEDIVAINQKTDDVKGLINQKINSFKSLVSTPNYGVGGEVEGVVVEANHYGKLIKMEQNFLSRSSGDFSTIIILICGIIAFGVVARR